ncbi:MAG: histidine kinase [Gemmatimonadales bacterium]|nr:histidine kinase [Gemmatimonadales bacterium]
MFGTPATRLISPLAGALIWLGLSVVFTMSAIGLYAVKGDPQPLDVAFWWAGAEWLIYGLLSPLVFASLRRAPLDRARLTRSLAILLLTWFAFHLTVQMAFVILERTFFLGNYQGMMSFSRHLLMFMVRKAAFTFVVIAVMVGVHHLGELYSQARERERRAAQLRADLAQSRLQTLRGQLHPHFLFNTLNTIAALIHSDPDGAERVTSRLGDLLRETLQDDGNTEVPLSHEFDFLRRYAEVQQTRFADRLSVTIEASPDVMEALVPSLVLQPLVENAIRHGIEPRAATGTVRVTARRVGGRLELEVRDDGVGLQVDGHNGHGTEGFGVGLRNTRMRLLELFGEGHHSFTISPADTGGTLATISIPWKLDGGEHNG